MDARTALRRIAARAISSDGFDPSGINDLDSLRAELAPEIEQLRAEGQINTDHTLPGTGR
jgi:hypothetical protein